MTSSHAAGRLQNVTGGEAQIVNRDATTHVPLRSLNGLRISRHPKVSLLTLELSNFKGERCYTMAADPQRKASEQLFLMANVRADRMQAAESAVVQAEMARPELYDGSDPRGAPLRAARSAADQQMTATMVETANDLYSPGLQARKSADDDAKELYDAYEIVFELTSPEPIDDAYVAMVTVIHLPDTPHKKATVVKVRELPPLSSTPQKIRINHGGLPLGFAVDTCNLHVFRQGREIATSASERRISVTKAEARQFLLLQRQVGYPNGSASAVVALELVPLDFGDHVPADVLERTVQVRLDTEGTVIDFTLDSSVPPNVASYITSVLHDSPFLPALAEGKPIHSTAIFALSEFVRYHGAPATPVAP